MGVRESAPCSTILVTWLAPALAARNNVADSLIQKLEL